MATKPPTWKSKDVVDPYVETQGTNRKHHDRQLQGPVRDSPNLLLGFKSKNGYEYGQTGNLRFWVKAPKTGVPKDQTRVFSGSVLIRAHTVKVTSGSVDGTLFTSKKDTPFVGRYTPKPYKPVARCLVFNTGSADYQFMHMSSSNYLSVASGTAGTHNLATTWNFWMKPRQVGHDVTRITIEGYSAALSSNYDLLITDLAGNMYSASCDSSLAKASSTAKRIGISDVTAVGHMSQAIRNSIKQAIQYGINSSVLNTASGQRLQFELAPVDSNNAAQRLFQLTSSVDGAFDASVNITGGLIKHADSPVSLTASYGSIPRYIFSKASGSMSSTRREYDLSIDQHSRLTFNLYDESAGKKVTKTTDLAISGSEIKKASWQNICVTYSGKSGSYAHQGVKIYRNGILISSGNAGTTESGYWATENNHGDLVIGRAHTGSDHTAAGSGPGIPYPRDITADNDASFLEVAVGVRNKKRLPHLEQYRGKLSEFAMWRHALNENEVLALYGAREHFVKMDTAAIDHLRQGVSVLTQKQRWSGTAPKISGIGTGKKGELGKGKINHEQEQLAYGQMKLFRDNTPFEELEDAERLRINIATTVVGSKASASITFNGFDLYSGNTDYRPAFVLTGANAAKKVFYFTTDQATGHNNPAKFTAAEWLPVVVSGSTITAVPEKSSGSEDYRAIGALYAKALADRIRTVASSLQITANTDYNRVKFVSTVTGTAGNTLISLRSIKSSSPGQFTSTGSSAIYTNGYDAWITSSYISSNDDYSIQLAGGNATMKQHVTQALGGAIDYLNSPYIEQYPIILTNVSFQDPGALDGNIEPLALRETFAWSAIDTPFLPRTTRGTFMGGEENVIYGSSQIEQFYRSKNPFSGSGIVPGEAGRAWMQETVIDPFIDAQDVMYSLGPQKANCVIRFAKVPSDADKIVLRDSMGQVIAFEFQHGVITGSWGKARNKPTGSNSGQGTWCVYMNQSGSLDLGSGDTMLAGSTHPASLKRTANLFSDQVSRAFTLKFLNIKPITAPGTYGDYIDQTGKVYKIASTTTSPQFVRLDQQLPGEDGNRRIVFVDKLGGSYIVNGVTASVVYSELTDEDKFKELVNQFGFGKEMRGRRGRKRRRNLRRRKGRRGVPRRRRNFVALYRSRLKRKMIRKLAHVKYGVGFGSGSDEWTLPAYGFNSDVIRRIVPFNDTMFFPTMRVNATSSMVLSAEGVSHLRREGPSKILTSTLKGFREWNEYGHGYKSAGAGFTYNNDVFGTDSIAFGGLKK